MITIVITSMRINSSRNGVCKLIPFAHLPWSLTFANTIFHLHITKVIDFCITKSQYNITNIRLNYESESIPFKWRLYRYTRPVNFNPINNQNTAILPSRPVFLATDRFTSVCSPQPRRMRKKALPSRLGPTLESRLSLDSRVSDRQRKALELGKQTAITVEVESGAERQRVLLHAQDAAAARRTFGGRGR